VKTVYITLQGSVVRKKRGGLEILKSGEVVERLLLKDITQIVVVGNVTLTAGVVEECLDRGIDVVFTGYSGRYRGRLVGVLGSNVVLRMEQCLRFCDPSFTLELSRKHVYGKVHNMLRLLIRYNYKLKNPDISKAVKELKALITTLPDREEVSSVRGVEGRASAVYFSVFGALIKNEDFKFSRRTKHPPMDEVNALLSLGYTLMMNRVEGAVNLVGMDPYVGSLHELENGKPSLVLDILEEFRFAVDAMVVRLINRRYISKADFEFASAGEDGGLPVMLTRTGFRKFVKHFGEVLEEKYLYSDDKVYPLKEIILNQARLMARHILGSAEYQPFLWG